MNKPRKTLQYFQPAENFQEALPIGSGRLGAMIYSGTAIDRFSLNEDSIWAGVEAPKVREGAKEAFEKARTLLFANQRHEAQYLLESELETPFVQPYLPAGSLFIAPLAPEDWSQVSQYRRELDLGNAIATSEFVDGKVKIFKESFASHPDDLIVVRWVAEGGLLPPLSFTLVSELRNQTNLLGPEIRLLGDMPTNVRWNAVDDMATPENFISYGDNARRYAIIARIVSTDGQLTPSAEGLTLTGASVFTLHISIASSARETAPERSALLTLDRAQANFNTLKARHIADYERLFGSFSLSLGGSSPQEADSGDWLIHHSADERPAVLEKLFDFGRYLLISSSREGTMPANLQGVWNERIDPPWWSNYTLNINTQMNYWGAEMTGLGECHLPLFDFIAKLAANGTTTAREQYGARGWVVHHQTDYHAQTTPVGFLPHRVFEGSAKWSLWVMGGPWLCLHIIEHAFYNEEWEWLAEYYPVLEGAAQFLCDWLVVDPTNPAQLTTAPSTSPENTYIFEDGKPCAICNGSTMDIAIARQFFDDMLATMAQLGIYDALTFEILEKRAILPPVRFSDDGRILEFDADWPEAEAPHRHISQLFALTPGNSINPHNNPELAQAAYKTLKFRGDSGTGWSIIWKARCYARLGMGQKAYQMLSAVLNPVASSVTEMADDGGGIYPNFFLACPPLMIEANLGYIAALLELFVQVHGDEVILLPALPIALSSGEIRDLCLPNQIRLSMVWKSYQVVELWLKSYKDGELTLRLQGDKFCTKLKAGNWEKIDLVEARRMR